MTFTQTPEWVDGPVPADLGAAGTGLGVAHVVERTGVLVATPQARAAFATYLDGLETGGYARLPEMAAYITHSRALIAAAASEPAHMEVA